MSELASALARAVATDGGHAVVGDGVIATDGDPDAARGPEEAILNAALVEVGEQGTRRATMDAIARRAGVGRITVFRRFGSKDELVARLLDREIRRFLAAIDRAVDGIDDPVEQTAEAFLACMRAGAHNPLIARLAELSPGALLDQMRQGSPSPLELGKTYVAARLAAGQRHGRLGPGDAEAVADVLTRLAVSYVLLPSPQVDADHPEGVRRFARDVLGPLLGP